MSRTQKEVNIRSIVVTAIASILAFVLVSAIVKIFEIDFSLFNVLIVTFAISITIGVFYFNVTDYVKDITPHWKQNKRGG